MVEIISDRSGVAASERLDPSGVPSEMESSLGNRFSRPDGRDDTLADDYDVVPIAIFKTHLLQDVTLGKT